MFKVLTIDDDPAMTELVTLLLKTHGLDAYMANSGEDGLELIHKVSPDVVILDLMMPEMDGWQVCTQVRSFSTVPILILSALDSPGSGCQGAGWRGRRLPGQTSAQRCSDCPLEYTCPPGNHGKKHQ